MGGTIGNIKDMMGTVTDTMNSLSKGTLGYCYNTPNFNSNDICSMLPQNDSFGANVCSFAPNLPGMSKKSQNQNLADSNILQSYCNSPQGQVGNGSGGTIGDLENGKTESSVLKKPNATYKGGKTVSQHYGEGGNGSLKKILSKKGVGSTAMLTHDQRTLKLVDEISKSTGKDFNDITIEEVINKLPENKEGYINAREAKAATIISDLTTYSPYIVSATLQNELQGKQGLVAKNKKDEIVAKAIDSIDAGTEIRIGFELALDSNPDDFYNPTQEYIQYRRVDTQLADVDKATRQLNRETKVITRVKLENDARKNMIYLTGEKALIMNEVFDRATAKAEIEKLIK
ncbi:hypothetical protein [Campylobacter fetus]|uniref:hypothetical protein n=2 Tax=Campylobacter fetus TaxID=196 RepID=UPI001131F56A|nr:hypothetical protein [Campylobacter fetus]